MVIYLINYLSGKLKLDMITVFIVVSANKKAITPIYRDSLLHQTFVKFMQ
jgi:hypothetical protein